jgi:hypothetical protein
MWPSRTIGRNHLPVAEKSLRRRFGFSIRTGRAERLQAKACPEAIRVTPVRIKKTRQIKT